MPGLAQWVKDRALLWLCEDGSTTPIGLLAWELPYALGAALKRQKEKKKEEMLKIKKQKTTVTIKNAFDGLTRRLHTAEKTCLL